jgi:predicted RNA binding protein YcfA (HicA-like mRNA interferase family)
MSELPTVSGKQALSAFLKAGFTIARTSASHHVLKKNGHRFNLSVPIHSNRDLKVGTLRGLIRASGLTVDQFKSYL